MEDWKNGITENGRCEGIEKVFVIIRIFHHSILPILKTRRGK